MTTLHKQPLLCKTPSHPHSCWGSQHHPRAGQGSQTCCHACALSPTDPQQLQPAPRSDAVWGRSEQDRELPVSTNTRAGNLHLHQELRIGGRFSHHGPKCLWGTKHTNRRDSAGHRWLLWLFLLLFLLLVPPEVGLDGDGCPLRRVSDLALLAGIRGHITWGGNRASL